MCIVQCMFIIYFCIERLYRLQHTFYHPIKVGKANPKLNMHHPGIISSFRQQKNPQICAQTLHAQQNGFQYNCFSAPVLKKLCSTHTKMSQFSSENQLFKESLEDKFNIEVIMQKLIPGWCYNIINFQNHLNHLCGK